MQDEVSTSYQQVLQHTCRIQPRRGETVMSLSMTLLNPKWLCCRELIIADDLPLSTKYAESECDQIQHSSIDLWILVMMPFQMDDALHYGDDRNPINIPLFHYLVRSARFNQPLHWCSTLTGIQGQHKLLKLKFVPQYLITITKYKYYIITSIFYFNYQFEVRLFKIQ